MVRECCSWKILYTGGNASVPRSFRQPTWIGSKRGTLCRRAREGPGRLQVPTSVCDPGLAWELLTGTRRSRSVIDTSIILLHFGTVLEDLRSTLRVNLPVGIHMAATMPNKSVIIYMTMPKGPGSLATTFELECSICVEGESTSNFIARPRRVCYSIVCCHHVCCGIVGQTPTE